MKQAAGMGVGVTSTAVGQPFFHDSKPRAPNVLGNVVGSRDRYIICVHFYVHIILVCRHTLDKLAV